MLRAEKHESITELAGIYKHSSSVIITHYHGLSVSQITALRKALKVKGASFKIVKNTLSKIAAARENIEKIDNFLVGPTALAYSKDPIDAAKILVEFAKTNISLKIVAGLVENEVLDANAVQQLATLPSLDGLRGKIIGVLQAPATKIAAILQVPAARLARVCGAYADKK